MHPSRDTLRWAISIAAAVLLFVIGFAYGSGFRFGSEERRVIGSYVDRDHTLVFAEDHRFSLFTPYEHLAGRWSKRTDQSHGFRLDFDDPRYSGGAEFVGPRFGHGADDLSLRISDYFVRLSRVRSTSEVVLPPKSPN